MRTTLIIALLILTNSAFAQDKIDLFAHAVAKAEGFYDGPRTLPARCHNPGDLKAAYHMTYPGQVGVCKGGHIRFRRDADGWAALRNQIEKALSGQSHFYSPNMTLRQVAKKYAADYRIWLKNVCHNLGDISPNTTLREYFDLHPTYVAPDDIDFFNFDFLQGEK